MLFLPEPEPKLGSDEPLKSIWKPTQKSENEPAGKLRGMTMPNST